MKGVVVVVVVVEGVYCGKGELRYYGGSGVVSTIQRREIKRVIF